MKTKQQIEENIRICKEKIEESYKNEQMFADMSTPKMRDNYRKTREYIQGWIDYLEDIKKHDQVDEYNLGYKNAKKWEKSKE